MHARVSEDDGWYTTRGLDPNIRPYLNEALDKCTYLRERGHEAIQYPDTESYRVARCGVGTYAGEEKAPSPPHRVGVPPLRVRHPGQADKTHTVVQVRRASHKQQTPSIQAVMPQPAAVRDWDVLPAISPRRREGTPSR